MPNITCKGNNTKCLPFQLCHKGTCAPKIVPECISKQQCKIKGAICKNGKCQKKCQTDVDCMQAESRCKNGFCIWRRRYNACYLDKHCKSGLCHKMGECKPEGFCEKEGKGHACDFKNHKQLKGRCLFPFEIFCFYKNKKF